MLLAWLLLLYYVIFPVLTTSTKLLSSKGSSDNPWDDFERQKRLLSLLPKKSGILYWFIFFSILYFMVIFSITNIFTNVITDNKSYTVSNSALIIDKDEDDNTKKELLAKTNIDVTDTDGVYSDKLVTPDTTYDLYIKQNYPNIKIPTKWYVSVCKIDITKKVDCSDTYNYKIEQNIGNTDKNWMLKIEIADSPILLRDDNWYISSNELKEILIMLKQKGLLSIYNEWASWILSFHNNDKSSNVFSPGAIHILYSVWYKNKVWINGYDFMSNVFEWLWVKANAVDSYFYPRFMEGKINFPKQEVQQIRTYSVNWLRATYINTLPYEWAGFSSFISDLKAKWFDVNKLITAIFGTDWSQVTNSIIAVNKGIASKWSDTNTGIWIVVRMLSYIYYFLMFFYQIAVVALIILLIFYIISIYIAENNLHIYNGSWETESKDWDNKNDNIIKRKMVNMVKTIWNGMNNTVDNSKEIGNTFLFRFIIMIVSSYVLAMLYINILTNLFNIEYADYSTAWMRFILSLIIIMIISYATAWLVNKLFDKIIRGIVVFIKNRTVWKE